MASSIDYDSEMIETYTTTSSNAEFISNHDTESGSEQEHQANEFDSEEGNEEEKIEESYEETTWRTDRFQPKRFAFDSSDSGISLD